ERPGIPSERERPPQTAPEDAPLIALSEAVVRTRALESGLAYELLAARADLQRIVTAVRDGLTEPDLRTLQGWRRELVGTELLDLLQGRLTLGIAPDRTVTITPAA